MPINLKFHIGNLVIGLVISFWWYYHEKKKPGLPLASIILLGTWVVLMALLFSSQRNITFLQAIPTTLDARNYGFGHTMMRSFYLEANVNAGSFFIAIMIAVHTMFFRWVWLMKNKKEANKEW